MAKNKQAKVIDIAAALHKQNKRVKYVDRLPMVFNAWNAITVSSAIEQQKRGNWSLSTSLGYTMLCDGQLGAMVDKLIDGLVRIDITVEPKDETNPDEVAAAKYIQDNYHRIVPNAALVQMLRNFLLVRAAPARIEWRLDERILGDEPFWYPVLCPRSPANLSYYHSELLTGNTPWKFNTMDGQEPLCPGDERWLLITDWHPGIPLGIASTLGMVWLSKQIARANGSDIAGKVATQKLKAIVPAGEEDEDDRQAFADDVVNMRNTSVIVCPQDTNGFGYDVVAIPFNNDGWEIVKDQEASANADYAVTILGDTTERASTAIFGGNDKEIQLSIIQQKIQALASIIDTAIHEQLFTQFINVSFPYGTQVPWATHKISLTLGDEVEAEDDVAKNEDNNDALKKQDDSQAQKEPNA